MRLARKDRIAVRKTVKKGNYIHDYLGQGEE